MMGATLLALLMTGAALPACAARGQDGADVAAQPTPTLEEMTGQMLLVGFRGLDAPDGSPVARAITEEHVAGVVLFDYDTQLKQPGRNITSPAQLDALTDRLRALAGRPLILSVDQEGGRVQRLKERGGFTPSPSAAELGRTGLDTAPTFASARALGAQMAEHGLNLDFAPVLDVNVNPESPAIGALGRSFSSDPDIVAAQ
ncbi:MAG: glycoside hydrolase family 3 N-terminal domain-containing protein, partial [Desulfovibrionaceae bacterium]